MGRVLRRTVITGGVTYPAGTAETAELKKAITNPVAWDGEPDSEEAPAPKKAAARKRTTAKAETKVPAEDASGSVDSSSDESTSQEPPRGGEGATEDAWRAYATGLDIEVPEGAGRDDIIALVDAAAGEK